MDSAPSLEPQSSGPKQSFGLQCQRFALALVSAVLPGSGQFFQRRIRASLIYFATFVVVFSIIAGLRTPLTYPGFITTVFVMLALAIVSGWSVLFFHPDGSLHISRWWILPLLVAVVAVCNVQFKILSQAIGTRTFSVPSSSMDPTIRQNEKIMTDFRAYKAHRPQRGNVVVVLRTDGIFHIKRVIGIPGDRVSISDGHVSINDHPILEPYVEFTSTPYGRQMPSVTVPPNRYFLMGDARDIAIDSRDTQFGLPDASQIKGRVLFIVKAEDSSRNGKTVVSAPPADAPGKTQP